MAIPSSTFTELVSTTYRKHKKEFADNLTNKNAMLAYIDKRGNKVLEDGGESLVCGLRYNENATYQRYSGYDTLNIQASDVITSANYDWKQIAVHVTANGLELRKNAGSATRIKNLAKERMMAAMETAANNFSEDLYSDGTASNQINGLQALIADAGTGTVGGINSSTFTFWQNAVQDANAPLNGGAGVTPSATTIEGLMLDLYLEVSRGNEQPDLIVCDNNYFSFYEQSQTSIKRYTSNEREVTGGFMALKYKNADVIFDGGSGIPSDHMYFINTKYLKLHVHKDADFTEVADKTPINQDSVVMPILWMGNLLCNNRARQGVLLDNA